MKRIFCVLFLLSLFACNQNSYLFRSTCYEVYKIKQHEEWYEIYAKQGRRNYLILSRKDDVNNRGIKIKQGGCYKFQLKSDYDMIKKTFGVEMIPNHRFEVKYYAENLKGLYLVE